MEGLIQTQLKYSYCFDSTKANVGGIYVLGSGETTSITAQRSACFDDPDCIHRHIEMVGGVDGSIWIAFFSRE
jgi:hypothetical protein